MSCILTAPFQTLRHLTDDTTLDYGFAGPSGTTIPVLNPSLMTINNSTPTLDGSGSLNMNLVSGYTDTNLTFSFNSTFDIRIHLNGSVSTASNEAFYFYTYVRGTADYDCSMWLHSPNGNGMAQDVGVYKRLNTTNTWLDAETGSALFDDCVMRAARTSATNLTCYVSPDGGSTWPWSWSQTISSDSVCTFRLSLYTETNSVTFIDLTDIKVVSSAGVNWNGAYLDGYNTI